MLLHRLNKTAKSALANVEYATFVMLFCACRCFLGHALLPVFGSKCWQIETDIYKYFGDGYSTLFSHIIFHIPYLTVPYRVKYATCHFIDGLLKIYILKLDNIKR